MINDCSHCNDDNVHVRYAGLVGWQYYCATCFRSAKVRFSKDGARLSWNKMNPEEGWIVEKSSTL